MFYCVGEGLSEVNVVVYRLEEGLSGGTVMVYCEERRLSEGTCDLLWGRRVVSGRTVVDYCEGFGCQRGLWWSTVGKECSLSLWRVVRGSKLMHLDLIHGLFIT